MVDDVPTPRGLGALLMRRGLRRSERLASDAVLRSLPDRASDRAFRAQLQAIVLLLDDGRVAEARTLALRGPWVGTDA